MERLTKKILDMESEMKLREKQLLVEIAYLKNKLDQSKFTVDRFQHNKVHFKFYTGFESYEMFKVVLEYLKPAANSLIYWGSSSKVENTQSNTGKRGCSRLTTPEEEFFMTLTRLRCAFPIEDLGIRFNMSTSNISRILVTWIDFLHTHLRILPIWVGSYHNFETS